MNLVLILILLFTSWSAGAATYYVAPGGSGSGTIASPFGTLQAAHNVAVAGDTIYMRGGTYNHNLMTTLTRDGTSGNRINVFNFPGELPILDGINQPDGPDASGMIFMDSASWWYIKGIEMKNGPVNALFAQGTSGNNIFEMLNMHHMGRLANAGGTGGGLLIYGTGSNNLVLNCDSHDNDDELGSGGGANGFNLVNTGTGNVFRGNRAWRNSDDGFDMWLSTPATLDSNWTWESGYDTDGVTPRGNGIGFKLGSGSASSNDGGHTLTNNVAWRNRLDGYHQNGGSLPMIMFNNSAWDNVRQNYTWGDGTATNTWKNNLSFGTLGSITGTATFNSWNLAVTVNSSDFNTLDFTCMSGPRRPDGRLPLCKFLRLVAGSDLLDKGTNSGVGLPFAGTNPDLGAFERDITNWPSGSPLLKEVAGIMQLTADVSPNLTQSEGFPYVSGMITTEGSYTRIYGYYEARIKAPVGQGFLSAFWLFPSDCGNHRPEMDIFEAHGAPTNIFYTHAHPEAGTGTETNISGGHTHTDVIDSTDGYHIYGLEWTPTYIAWFADGVEVRRVVNYSNEGQYVLLSLAVGGNWQGNPNAQTPFPAHMDVDYVRIYQKP